MLLIHFVSSARGLNTLCAYGCPSDYTEEMKIAVTDGETEQFVHQAYNTFDFGSIFINRLHSNWVISLPLQKRGYKDTC